MATIVNNNNVLSSTAYYRRNKIVRKKIHKCSHCEYETTGPKTCLTAHVLAKHTDKKNLPFSCVYCKKTFAQKQNCITHIERHHAEEAERDNIFESDMYRKKNATFQFIISPGKYMPTSVKTKQRYEFYLAKKVIKKNEFKTEELKTKGITLSRLKYDTASEYIRVKEVSLKDSRQDIDKQKKIVRKLTNIRIVER